MTMKKHLIVTLVIMMTGSMAFAQKKHGGWKDGSAQADKMKTELSLTDQQYASIKSIDEKYKNKFVALRSDSTVNRDTKFKQAKELKTERQKEVYKVLTPEQHAKWQAYKKDQAMMKKEQREKARAEHYEKLKTDLSLTDDQLTKVKDTNERFAAKRRELKKSKTEKSELKKLKAEHEASIKTILSEEQFAKWKAANEKRKDEAREHKGKHRRN